MPRKPSSDRRDKPGPPAAETGQVPPVAPRKRDPARTPTRIRQEILALDRVLLETIQQRLDLFSEWAAESAPDDPPLETMDEQWLRKVIPSGAVPKSLNWTISTAQSLLLPIERFCQAHVAPTQVTYLGPIYSYSYLAAAECFGEFQDLVPVNSIAAVFDQVAQGKSDFGVVPIENSTDGRIADTLTMIAQHAIAIYREVHLPIHHCLIGSGNLEDIREIRSKAQALSQCRNWLDRTFSPKVKRVAADSSSDAARDALDGGKHVAAIASRQAALGLNLRVIASDIEDQPDNRTRFAVIVNPEHPRIQLPGKTGQDKTSIMFEIPHRPGALADAINVFKRARLNLTWIESFPKPGAYSEYTFFAEFQGHRQEARVRNALVNLEKKTDTMTVLGSYPDQSDSPPTPVAEPEL